MEDFVVACSKNVQKKGNNEVLQALTGAFYIFNCVDKLFSLLEWISKRVYFQFIIGFKWGGIVMMLDLYTKSNLKRRCCQSLKVFVWCSCENLITHLQLISKSISKVNSVGAALSVWWHLSTFNTFQFSLDYAKYLSNWIYLNVLFNFNIRLSARYINKIYIKKFNVSLICTLAAMCCFYYFNQNLSGSIENMASESN